MFPGFTLETIPVGDVRLRVRHGGSGPPVVLLHGHPRTHVTWHRVAPLLAAAWWHWFFFAQPDKPERAILADPEAWYRNSPERMGEEAYADYRAAIHDPATVHAMLEDYRAGLGIDRRHDEADRAAGRRVRCPLLVLWAEQDDMQALYGDILPIWRAWADDVHGHGLPCGHHMAEEAPERLAGDLLRFFARR